MRVHAVSESGGGTYEKNLPTILLRFLLGRYYVVPTKVLIQRYSLTPWSHSLSRPFTPPCQPHRVRHHRCKQDIARPHRPRCQPLAQVVDRLSRPRVWAPAQKLGWWYPQSQPSFFPDARARRRRKARRLHPVDTTRLKHCAFKVTPRWRQKLPGLERLEKHNADMEQPKAAVHPHRTCAVRANQAKLAGAHRRCRHAPCAALATEGRTGVGIPRPRQILARAKVRRLANVHAPRR